MKKNYLLVALALLIFSSANAEKRTKSQLISAASEVLTSKSITSTPNSKTNLTILDSSLSQLSIVGYEKGAFVLVANDDAVPAIIGYSDSNASFDADNMAPAFKWYLEIANRNIEERLLNGTPVKTASINPDYKPEVPMLCQTKWGQAAPYYNQTPTYGDNDTHYVTGCVATAMAQAMKYYNYPETGRGKITFYFQTDEGKEKVKVGFGDEIIDWANMLNEYTNYQYNSDNAEAVAYLMKLTGASVKMMYAPGGSGAFTMDAATAFINYFKYDPSVDCYHKDFMHEDEWYDLIYHSLSDGCPVVFGASSSVGGQDAGHSFVVDGYDAKGLVHVNFGWDGNSDGNYSLLDMHGYDHGFEAVPLKMPSPDYHITSFWGIWDNLKYNKTTGVCEGNIINTSSRPFSGKVAVILKNLADGTEQMIGYDSYKEETYTDGQYLNIKKYKVQAPLPTDLADGEYRLYLASKGEWMVQDDPTDKKDEPKLVEEKSWQPVHSSENVSNCVLITVQDGAVTTKNGYDSSWVLGIDNIVSTNNKSNIVNVYDLQGRMIYTSTSKDFRISDVPAEGMLIIKEGNEVRKVMK